MDHTITQCKNLHYTFYHMHPTTSHSLATPSLQQLPAPTTAAIAPAGTILAIQPPLLSQPGMPPTNPQTIDILDDITNPALHNQAHNPTNQHLDDIVSASISAAFCEQYSNYSFAMVRQQLDTAIPNHASVITLALNAATFLSWCDLTDGEPLPPLLLVSIWQSSHRQ